MRAPPSSSREQSANIDSYNEVLRGRYFDRRGTKEDSARALSAFERAIKLDPTNAEAWVGLAAAYYVRGAMSWTPPLEAYAEARKALDRALTINPDLASAHAYLGALEWYYNRDFTAAEREFNRSFELDPSQAADPMYEGVLAAAAGRTDEALAAFRRARDINPLDINTLLTLASTLDDTDLPGAERLYRQILEINPDVAAAYCNLGQIRLAQHQPEAALALMSKEPDEGIRMTCMPDALWDLGRHQEADAMLAQVESKFADSMALALATCYARRNEKDTAFKWLSRAYDNHEPMITMIKSIPELHILHSDPRFSNLLQKLNLPR